jgi:CheY-like chemotaxis protein
MTQTGPTQGRLLIVDDDPRIRNLLATIVHMHLPAVSVETAQNGREAVEDFVEHRPNVILMDLHMPQMDGLQAHQAIEAACAENHWEMPPVIFCTGFAVPDRMDDILAAHPRHGLLHKPVKTAQLIGEIQDRL